MSELQGRHYNPEHGPVVERVITVGEVVAGAVIEGLVLAGAGVYGFIERRRHHPQV